MINPFLFITSTNSQHILPYFCVFKMKQLVSLVYKKHGRVAMPNFSGTKSNCSLMPIQRKGKKVGSMLNSSPFASSTQGSSMNGITLILQFIDTPTFLCHPSYILKITLSLHSQLPNVVCSSSSNHFGSPSSSVFKFLCILGFSKLYSFQILLFSPKIGLDQFELDHTCPNSL